MTVRERPNNAIPGDAASYVIVGRNVAEIVPVKKSKVADRQISQDGHDSERESDNSDSRFSIEVPNHEASQGPTGSRYGLPARYVSSNSPFLLASSSSPLSLAHRIALSAVEIASGKFPVSAYAAASVPM